MKGEVSAGTAKHAKRLAASLGANKLVLVAYSPAKRGENVTTIAMGATGKHQREAVKLARPIAQAASPR